MKKFLLFSASAAFSVFFTSCASTAPSAKFNQTIAAENRVGANDQVAVVVNTPEVTDMLSVEKTRLGQRIDQKIDAAKTANSGQRARKLQLDLTVTPYDKGNAFARGVLAGLGQIHLDGTAKLIELPGKKQIGEFTLNKTFA